MSLFKRRLAAQEPDDLDEEDLDDEDLDEDDEDDEDYDDDDDDDDEDYDGLDDYSTDDPEAREVFEEEADALTEEAEDAILDAKDRRTMDRFAKRCLRTAIGFVVAGALLFLAEAKLGICFGYTLAPHVIPLAFFGGGMLALIIAMIGLQRKIVMALVLLCFGWYMILLYGIFDRLSPETAYTYLPGTSRLVQMTRVTSYTSTKLYIDEPIVWNVVSRRFTLPVQGRTRPMVELVYLEFDPDNEVVRLSYEDRLWAVYDPKAAVWYDLLHRSIPEDLLQEETTEPTTAPKKHSYK